MGVAATKDAEPTGAGDGSVGAQARSILMGVVTSAPVKLTSRPANTLATRSVLRDDDSGIEVLEARRSYVGALMDVQTAIHDPGGRLLAITHFQHKMKHDETTILRPKPAYPGQASHPTQLVDGVPLYACGRIVVIKHWGQQGRAMLSVVAQGDVDGGPPLYTAHHLSGERRVFKFACRVDDADGHQVAEARAADWNWGLHLEICREGVDAAAVLTLVSALASTVGSSQLGVVVGGIMAFGAGFFYAPFGVFL